MVIYIMPLKVYFSEIKYIETKVRQSSTKMGGGIVNFIVGFILKSLNENTLCPQINSIELRREI